MQNKSAQMLISKSAARIPHPPLRGTFPPGEGIAGIAACIFLHFGYTIDILLQKEAGYALALYSGGDYRPGL